MADTPVVYGLYEVFGATATADLLDNRIYHDLLVARDDAHAVELARKRSGGIQHLSITRKSDVYPT
jgi:hypothetical protein